MAFGLTALAGASLADGKRGHHHERGMRGGFGPGILERVDANGDGRATQAEIDQIRQDWLAEFDQDADGSLTLEEEYQALLAVGHARAHGRPLPALDDDGDALVTTDEYLEPFSRMVRRLDRNDDSELTAEDMRRRGGRHGPDRRHGHR